MSFLSLRRSRHQQPLQDAGNIADGSTQGSIYSVDKPPSAIRRFASKLSRTRRTGTAADPRGPVGNIAFPRSSGFWRSRSPSPDPSLDIRLPTGLGRRASEMEEQAEVDEYWLGHGRKRSVSSPAVVPRWKTTSPLMETLPALTRMPVELLAVVFSSASRRDAVSLTRVSKRFSQAGLRALYEDLDVRDLSDTRLQQCVASLASRRHLAGLVRHFACTSLPDAANPAPSLDVVSFAIAFTNMDQLHTLTLPHFDARLLTHATFALRHLTLLPKSMDAEEFHSFIGWLERQPTIVSLSFPALTLPALPAPDTPGKSDTGADERPPPIPATVLPRLQRYHGPVVLAAAFAPGRPLHSVTLPIQNTIYDGLRPSAIMGALAQAKSTLRILTITPATAKIDTRSLERVIMSAGSELGGVLETLELHWVLDEEVRIRPHPSLHTTLTHCLGAIQAPRDRP